MKNFRVDNIEHCPMQQLASTTCLILKNVCREKAIDEDTGSFSSPKQKADLLEDTLHHLQKRLERGYALIMKRCK